MVRVSKQLLILGFLLSFLAIWSTAQNATTTLTSNDFPLEQNLYIPKHYDPSFEDPEPESLVNKTYFVSGITHGQGPEYVRHLLLAGAKRVIGNGASDILPPDFIRDDPRVTYIRANMTSKEEVDEMVRHIYEDLGISKIDGFYGNAGRMYTGYTADNRAQDYADMILINCIGNYRILETFDHYGMIDHYDNFFVMFTSSIARFSSFNAALDPYAASKACIVDLAIRLQIAAVLNGWTDRIVTLSPFGVNTAISWFQKWPSTPASQLVCRFETEMVQSWFSGPPVDPYGPNPSDQTTVDDIGRIAVMITRYRRDFQNAKYSHVVIKAGQNIDDTQTGDWDYWGPLFYQNTLRFAHLMKEKKFPTYYPLCSRTHHLVTPSPSPTSTPSLSPSKTPRKSKGKKGW